MTTVSPVSMQRNVNFKGISQNENGIPYHKTKTGLVTGSAIGALGVLSQLGQGVEYDFVQKEIKKSSAAQAEEVAKIMEKHKKLAVPFAIIAATMSIGCGLLIDHIRNKKAAETADVIASSKNINEAFMRDENLQVNKYGLPYHHSNTGTKLGALLGGVCGLAHGAMIPNIQQNATGRAFNMLTGAVMMALAGWGVGALYDKMVNGKAEDASIKMYARPQI